MLRTRLILGLLCLLAILLAMGLYSIDRCSQLGKRIQIILNENSETIRSLQEIKSNLTKLTAALIANDQKIAEKIDFKEAFQTTEQAIQWQDQQRLSPAARKISTKLGQIFQAYRRHGEQLLSLRAQQMAQRRELIKIINDETIRLLKLSDELLEFSQQEMQHRNARTDDETTDTIRLLFLGMIVAVIVAIYASFRLTRGLLDPLATLATSLQQVGEGNLEQHVAVPPEGELGGLARSFNQMARQLKGYRDAETGKLARLNRTIQQTISSFPDPIFVLNTAGEVEFRNPPADAFAVKMLLAGVGRLPMKIEKLTEEVIASGQDFLPTLLKDAIQLHFDNRAHYYLPRIVLLRAETGEPFGAAVILENITHALLLDEVKTNLITTVSHELKTPLTSIITPLHLVLEQNIGPLNAQQNELLTTASQNADRLLNTLNDLLDLTRLEEGAPQLHRETMTPEALVGRALRQARDAAAASQHRLQAEVAPGLPSLLVDAQRLAYIFSNLLTNAIKYSPAGSTVFVRAEPGPAANQVRFSVRDQGAGIPEEHLGHIFEKFYRVPDSGQLGTGLGLSIAREIVRAHGGIIQVAFSGATGTEFEVILPSFSPLHPSSLDS